MDELSLPAIASRAPVAIGPLAACVVRRDAREPSSDVRVLYVDVAGLAERDDLRRALGLRPDEALTDMELVLRAYRRWGAACAGRLGGAFAFVVWDGPHRAVVAVRDPVGICPLFVAYPPGAVVFGGDIRRVLATEGVRDDWDLDIVTAHLLHPPFAPAERTCYRAIRAVPAGHTLTIRCDSVKAERYWRPEEAPEIRFRRDADYIDAFRTLYVSVVQDYLPIEGRIGVHVSGGLDSSGIAVLVAQAMQQAGREAPAAFAWQPAPRGALTEEHRVIEAVAARAGLSVAYVPPTVDDIIAFCGRDATRDPWRGGLLHEHVVQRTAAERGVDVLFSGWGGDEAATFSGRGMIEPYLLRTGQWRPLLGRRREGAGRWARVLLHAALRRGPQEPSLARLRREALAGTHETYLHPDLLRQARLPELPALPKYDPYAFIRSLLSRGHLTDRTTAWGVSGAEHGLRYCYPLLDRRILRFALGLPATQWLARDGRRRWLMREALADVLPATVRHYQIKRDPVRFGAAVDAIREGFDRLSTLMQRMPETDRSHWFDLPRLRTALAPGSGAHPWVVAQALGYLDFTPPDDRNGGFMERLAKAP